jgi:hypothetical protein
VRTLGETLNNLIERRGERTMKANRTLVWKVLSTLVILAVLIPANLFGPFVPVARADSLSVSIASNNDDAFDYASGSNYPDGSNIRLGNRTGSGYGNCTGGFRFQNVTIPRGSIINSAYLRVRATDNTSVALNLKVSADRVDNSVDFSSSSNRPSNRTRTTAQVDWDISSGWNSGTTYDSPNIGTVVQEIVNRTGWSSGNSLSIIVANDSGPAGNNRNVDTREGGYNSQLIIDYTLPLVLSYSAEAGYGGSDGVSPDLGTTSTTFVYKVVYIQSSNVPPSYVRVFVDGNSHTMSLDTSAAATLHDGNYANGEQYIYSTTLVHSSHNYYFIAYDGTNTARLPAVSGTRSGPVVNASPNTPLNSSPAAGATVNTRNPTFTWSSFSDPDGDSQSQFHIQIRQSAGAYPYREYTPTNSNANTYTSSWNLPDGGYCWHVQVSDNQGVSNSWSAYSAETCFTLDANQPPPPPALVDPPDGDVVPTNTPTLVWNSVTDPDGDTVSYGVSIDGGAFVGVGSVTQYTPGTPLSEGLHTWRVRACDPRPACGTTATWSFTVNSNVTNPNQDSYIDQDAPTSNYGTNQYMYVRSDRTTSSGQNRRMFLRFDMPALPTCPAGTAGVVHATLRVYADTAPSGLRTYDAYRANEAWIESGTGGITFNNQPDTVGSATDSLNISSVGWGSWDVTTDVQAFYDGTYTNYGWMIRDRAESETRTAVETRFRAREYSTTTFRPQLLIAYNCAPLAPTLISPLDGSATGDTTPTLKWNAAGDPNGDTLHYEFRLDGGTWNPDPGTATSYTTTLLPQGPHTWAVRAYDGYAYSDSSETIFTKGCRMRTITPTPPTVC